MRIAYFSPLNPQKSGISDYSEELLPHLAEGAEIDLFVDGFKPANREIAARFRVFDYVGSPEVLERLGAYDSVVYHMGNDHRYHARIHEVLLAHPGIVVLHDFALQDFFLGLARERGAMSVYMEEMEACHGREARRVAEEALARGAVPPQLAVPVRFPLNARIARAAEGIVVHSNWCRERLEEIAPGTPVKRVQMPVRADALAAAGAGVAGEQESRRVELASFGLITPGKGIELALRVLSTLRADHDFRYTLVGEPNSFFDIRQLIRDYGMSDRVHITGHVTLEEFERRIAATDIALNVRERTVGETSASLCRIMAAGVPAIVSDTGWFSELPRDSVIHLDLNEYTDALLHAYLKRLMEDAALRARIGRNARAYALAEHRVERSAADYLAFIREVIQARTRRRFVGSVSAELASLGIGAQADEMLRAVSAEVAALAPNAAFSSTSHDAPNGHHAASEEKAAQATAANQLLRTDQATQESPEPPSPEAAQTETETAKLSSDEREERGRLPKLEDIDYKRAAIEYPRKLDAERYHYLLTKPFYNLANKPTKHRGDGLDAETHRHFCDFANMAVALALPAGRRLLDVGCGSGWLCEYFSRLGYDATGIDISPDLIEAARERLARITYGVDHETSLRYRFLVHDIESAPLAEQFDAVICYDSLHHFVDEHAVLNHLAAMLPIGGLLFVLEGDKPDEGSATEAELIDVMRRYETLESPFSPRYLRRLLDEHGFAVVGDYVSVNGLFEREALEAGTRLEVEPSEVNYLLCKKVAENSPASAVPDSRRPGHLSARLSLREQSWVRRVAPGEMLSLTLDIENTGDTLWLAGGIARSGIVMPAVRIFDEAGACVDEFHGDPPLPRPLAPGERVRVRFMRAVPQKAGRYRFKIDLVDQHICWFEERGSQTLTLAFEVE